MNDYCYFCGGPKDLTKVPVEGYPQSVLYFDGEDGTVIYDLVYRNVTANYQVNIYVFRGVRK